MGTCYVSWGKGFEEKEPAEGPLWPQTLPQAAPANIRTALSGPLLEDQFKGSHMHRDSALNHWGPWETLKLPWNSLQLPRWL